MSKELYKSLWATLVNSTEKPRSGGEYINLTTLVGLRLAELRGYTVATEHAANNLHQDELSHIALVFGSALYSPEQYIPGLTKEENAMLVGIKQRINKQWSKEANGDQTPANKRTEVQRLYDTILHS